MEFINAVLIPILIVTMQMSDTYLRFLAFRRKFSETQRKKFWRNMFVISMLVFFIYFAIFKILAVTALIYKLILIIGWIPFFIASIKFAPLTNFQHFFILGMGVIWNLFLHSVASIIDINFFADESHIFILTFHAINYLILFVIFLPIERKFFINLLPEENFFDNQPYGKYIVLVPFLIVSGILILWVDDRVFHSWQERFSRLYLPFTFLLFYRYVLAANQQIFEKQKAFRYNQHLKEQISALKQYNFLMQKNHEQMKILHHDMRHNYRIIFSMLQEKKFDEIVDFIKLQENLLDKTTVKFFCKSPLINAALSIYLQIAEKFKIKIRHKINLPEKFFADETDFAILISNLLENAINASKLQPKNRRKISITIEHIENQCALEIKNLCDK